MEHFHMTLGFHIECFFHGATLNENRYIAIQYVHFLMRIRYHYLGSPNAGDADDDTTHKE